MRLRFVAPLPLLFALGCTCATAAGELLDVPTAVCGGLSGACGGVLNVCASGVGACANVAGMGVAACSSAAGALASCSPLEPAPGDGPSPEPPVSDPEPQPGAPGEATPVAACLLAGCAGLGGGACVGCAGGSAWALWPREEPRLEEPASPSGEGPGEVPY
jgi:hypothetical protein